MAVGNRVEVIENGQEEIVQAVADVQDTIKYEEIMNNYRDQLDNFKNRDRRQNIRIRGLPEKYHSSDLPVVVQKFFCQIMGTSAPESVEMDRVHRVTSYGNQNNDKPRDVICKLHKYSMKETIMRISWDTSTIEY